MTVGDLCTRPVQTVSHAMSVWDAARTMLEHHVGTLVVLDRGGGPEGMITDRDIVLRCVAKEFDPDELPVTEIMTSPLRTISADGDVPEALRLMAEGEMRRLVVLDHEGELYGVLTLDDLLSHIVAQGEWLGRLLETQVPV